MVALDLLVQKLDVFFGVRDLDHDPAFTRWLPHVYSKTNIPWRTIFEEDFCSRFNGLMLRGAERVRSVFCAAFPSPIILEGFLNKSQAGDLLFTHHPIDMECGDPRGAYGRGFQPIAPEHFDALRKRNLSIYACHAPLDTHTEVSTNGAIAAVLNAKVIGRFLPYGNGLAGWLCTIPRTTTKALIDRCLDLFDIPYVDFSGERRADIECLAITAGGGDRVECMREVEKRGAQAYLTGEIHHHIESEEWRTRFEEMQEYLDATSMSAIGVSHAGSEFLVMKTQLPQWLRRNFDVVVQPLAEPHWWR